MAVLEDERVFGVLVVDGNGALYGTLNGTAKHTLYSFKVELQSKSKAGGQSALRFNRLRREQRHNYERLVCETAFKQFWDPITERSRIEGLIIAGSAEFKQTVADSTLLDMRLKKLIVGVLDIQYGVEAGFNEAITQAGSLLSGLKLTDEAQLVSRWMTELSIGSAKVIFGLNETLQAYDAGVVTDLMVWGSLTEIRYTITGEETRVVYSRSPPELVRGELITDEIPLIDWLIEVPRNEVSLRLISDVTPQGSQFVKGFGGVGGFLQYEWQPEEVVEGVAEVDVGDDDEFGL